MANETVALTHICRKCGIRPGRKPDPRSVCEVCHVAVKREYMARYYAVRRETWNDKAKQDRRENPEAYREGERARWQRRKQSHSEYRKRQWSEMSDEQREEQYRKLAEWKLANPEKAKAIDRRRQERIKADPQLRAKAAARVARHRKTSVYEAYRNATVERRRAYNRRWAQENRVLVQAAEERKRERRKGDAAFKRKQQAYSAIRRAKKMGHDGGSVGDLEALIRDHGGACFYCCAEIEKYDIDHFIPLSRGGSNTADNLVISCVFCNRSKGAKLPWEWLPDRFTEASKPRG